MVNFKKKNVYLDNRTLESNIVEYIKYKKQKKCFELLFEDLKNNKNKKDAYDQKLLLYKDTCEKYNIIYNTLARNFLNLAEHIIKFKQFNYVEYDDAVQEFVMICFDRVERFDPNYIGPSGKKAKAFNYMTTCIFNHYKQMYRTAKNYSELKNKYKEYIDFLNKDPKVKYKKTQTNLKYKEEDNS